MKFIKALSILPLMFIYMSILFSQNSNDEIYVCTPCGCDNHDTEYSEPGNCESCGMALVLKSSIQQNEIIEMDSDVVFVCPPCGCSGDEDYKNHTGSCTHCGMTLVATYKDLEKPDLANMHRTRKKVAIFVFDGVQIIDFTGPYEVLGQAGWEVFTVSEKSGSITTSMNMTVVPNYSFDNDPQADILVLPGGGVNAHYQKPEVVEWIQNNYKTVEHTLSVCNGAFFLGEAGLLDGKQATTFAALIPSLQSEFPKAEVVSDQRFVDNGNIITSAGLSSGIDGALYLVSKYQGVGRTQEIATNLEYNWDPEAGYVRAALADYKLESLRSVLYQFDHETLKYQGGKNNWFSSYKLKTSLPQNRLMELLNTQLRYVEKWENTKSDQNTSHWKFADEKQNEWEAEVLTISMEGGYGVEFSIHRLGQ